MVSPIRISHKSTQEIPSLTVLTDPLLDRIIQVDFDALDDALEDDLMEPDSVWQESFIERCINLTTFEEFTFCSHTHLFAYSTLDDTSIAIILLIASIISLILTTLIIVKLIQMLLEGKLAIVLKEWLDKKFPSPFRWATNYLIMLLSCFLVMIIQSSNVIQSALTPLVGMGVVPLERLFPLILGSGIGASFTGILTAFSADPGQLKDTLQMAFCQTIYNLFGMLIFFPIPFIRQIPIQSAMIIGQKTAKYRWLALVYILVVFFLIPTYLLAISFLPKPFMIAAIILTLIFWSSVFFINYLQSNYRKQLPKCIRDWEFLPKWLHSCKPYDEFLTKRFSKRNQNETGRLTTVEKLIRLTIQTQV
uniref:Uncharacterized protein n=1 Tax=Panagrolaimus davidi TaxID=227884 RepID=A0A914PVI8_9BILA